MADDLFSKVLGGGAIEQAASIAHQRRQQALSQQRDALGQLDLTRRRAVVAGVKGKLGETLLNHLLASPYAAVTALAEKPIRLGLRKLDCRPVMGEQPLDCDDAFLCMNDHEGPFARSFYGRDAHFLEVRQEGLLNLGQQLLTQGVQRLAVLAPLSSWHAIGRTQRGIADEIEGALALLGFETVLFIRPAVDTAAANTGSVLQRFARGYLSIFNMMLPKGAETLRTDHLAQAAIDAARDPRPGVRVVDNEALLAIRAQQRQAGAARGTA